MRCRRPGKCCKYSNRSCLRPLRMTNSRNPMGGKARLTQMIWPQRVYCQRRRSCQIILTCMRMVVQEDCFSPLAIAARLQCQWQSRRCQSISRTLGCYKVVRSWSQVVVTRREVVKRFYRTSALVARRVASSTGLSPCISLINAEAKNCWRRMTRIMRVATKLGAGLALVFRLPIASICKCPGQTHLIRPRLITVRALAHQRRGALRALGWRVVSFSKRKRRRREVFIQSRMKVTVEHVFLSFWLMACCVRPFLEVRRLEL